MSDAIDTTNGQASFVAARDDAWHKLGITLPEEFTAAEAMEYGNLGGWNVRKAPVHVEVDGQMVPVPDQYQVVRNNPVEPGRIDVLTRKTVTGRMELIQNEEHAALLDALVDESGAHFDTAGALDGGRRVFLSMKLPGHVNIGGVDPVNNYIAAVNSHDGAASFSFMVTPVRIVCANTLNMAYQNHSHIIRIRHTKGARDILINQVREALDVTFNYLDAFNAEAEQMIQTELTQARFEELIAKEFGTASDHQMTQTRTTNKLDQMAELFADAQTQEGIRGTVWAGFNALTEWSDHFAPVRGTDAEREITRATKAILYPELFKQKARDVMMAEVGRKTLVSMS